MWLIKLQVSVASRGPPKALRGPPKALSGPLGDAEPSLGTTDLYLLSMLLLTSGVLVMPGVLRK